MAGILDLGSRLVSVRATVPLVHCITNYVTVNDVANILLAAGGSPIMSDDVEDAPEITRICGGLVINIGTLNARTIPAMHAAGKAACEAGHPVLLDPVGAGASSLRTSTAVALIDELDLACIRANASEMRTLVAGSSTTRGVDAALGDAITDGTLQEAARSACEFAREKACVVAVSGAIDLVADGERAFAIRNGDAMMSGITGSGCMLSALTDAYLVAGGDDQLASVVAAFCMMGIAGERARAATESRSAGTSTFRMLLIDEISTMTREVLEEGARYEQVI